MNSCTIYVLKLQGSKYYVGRTSDVQKRMAQHSSGRGSSWTRIHPVESLWKIYKDCDPYDEDKYTLKLMDAYGVENVRGGTYIELELPKGQLDMIHRQIRMASDRCLVCGSSKHFAFRCKNIPNGIPNGIPKDPLCEICMTDDHKLEDCEHF